MTGSVVSVVGLGYIGLPTAAVLAASGCRVIGIDVQAHVVETINAGRIHIVEPGLDAVVAKTVAAGNLRATTIAEPADAFLIAVPTPFKSDRTPDLRYVESACAMIAPVLKKGDTVILESTSPVGATEQAAAWLAAARPDLRIPVAGGEAADIAMAYCPERVLPGNVLVELVRNDRVIGGLTAACSIAARAVYGHFVEGECILTDARTAEMCKLTENAFRDVNIAFANELSVICDKLDIDVWELIRLANRHPRVNVLQPGPGVGGHCIACDPWFIVASAPEEARLIRTAREVNDAKPDWVMQKISAALGAFATADGAARPTLACYGLAFKPDIDDLRDSPALSIARRIAADGRCQLLVVEPHVDTLPAGLEAAQLATSEEASRADIHVLLVDHSVFKALPAPQGVRIDTRGMGW
jgi:UDP-N-acetyl-D-mannosaminuronic acid dehydrogenase